MRFSRKASALALVCATTIIGTVGALDASGETGGHFTMESDPGTLRITEGGTHFLQYSIPGMEPFECESEELGSIPNEKTITEIGFGRENNEPCRTKNGGKGYGETRFHFNKCRIVLKIGKKAAQDNTTDLECPTGGQLEITHTNCVIKVPAQKGFKGVSYNTVVEGGKHAITAVFTVGNMSANFEEGICVFLGTTHAMAVTGSITIFARDKAGLATGLTATGSEG
ncbi:MAG TPA: hypothetical protein VGB06_06670 [Solirubrobacterales bacterium]|jgi:hypothetical protein